MQSLQKLALVVVLVPVCALAQSARPGEGGGAAGGAGGGVDPNLASLRRALDAQSDPKRAVERLRQFIESRKGTPAADAAMDDLVVWEDRLRRGLVKFGTRWIDPSEMAAIRAGATSKALESLQALRESRLAAAEELLAAAVADDPSNPTANYLRGVLLFRQDKFREARAAFEASLAAAPGFGPTLNNMAVTATRLNQLPLAGNLYNQALTALGPDRGVLDNVAEYLEAVPELQRRELAYKRLSAKFTELDTLLAQRMAQRGLYRWGGTWVDQTQMAQLKEAERETKKQLDALAAQFDQLTNRATGLDTQIRQNEADLRRMEAESFRYDANGNVVRVPLPQIYYTLQNQTTQLRAERAAVDQQQQQLRSRARELQKSSPIPKFTGVQQLYSPEAAPVPTPPAATQPVPATQPATQPATRP